MGLENCIFSFPHHVKRIVTAIARTSQEPDGLRGAGAPAIVTDDPRSLFATLRDSS
jgi:hypothetical protein